MGAVEVRVKDLVLYRQFHLGEMERKQQRMIVKCPLGSLEGF